MISIFELNGVMWWWWWWVCVFDWMNEQYRTTTPAQNLSSVFHKYSPNNSNFSFSISIFIRIDSMWICMEKNKPKTIKNYLNFCRCLEYMKRNYSNNDSNQVIIYKTILETFSIYLRVCELLELILFRNGIPRSVNE